MLYVIFFFNFHFNVHHFFRLTLRVIINYYYNKIFLQGALYKSLRQCCIKIMEIFKKFFIINNKFLIFSFF